MRDPFLRTVGCLLGLLLAAASCSTLRSDAGCDLADESFFAVKTWRALDSWLRRYGACDDGYLAEGVSDFVARTLAESWHTLPQLQRQITAHPDFRRFVLRHIDATADWVDLDTIVVNATEHCPDGFRALCEAMATRAREKSAESKAVAGQ